MKIFWVEISKVDYRDFLKKIIKLKNKSIIFTPNPEMLLKAREDKDFKNILKQANYLLPDWIGLYIAFQVISNKNLWLLNFILLPYYFFNLFFRRRSLYKKYGDRICGSDLTEKLLYILEEEKERITIVDLYNPTDKAKVESQKIFKSMMQENFPGLKIDYYIYNPKQKEEVIQKIRTSKSKVLFSSLGMKAQEESVIEIMEKCENIKLWLAIWSSFDYITWFQKRAPEIFRILGIEWLYRLFTWPRKIDRLKRLWNAIFVFTSEVIKSK